MDDFAGLVALVTGGASGIGAATVEQLRRRGARVASLDLSPGEDSDGVVGLRCDVTSSAEVEAAVTAAVERFGRLDVVVNNAGIGAVGGVADNTDADWHRLLDVNVVGVARVTRSALPHLAASEHAVVVNTCSAVAHVGVPDRLLYSASKGAVEAMTKAMAADLVRQGVRVNAVSPGTADTPWVQRLLDASDDSVASAEALRRRQPLGRLVTAAEVAFAIANLASPLAGSTTGTVLRVDGGMTTLRLPS